MNSNTWSEIFSYSSFFAVNKALELSIDLASDYSKLSYDSAINTFHPNRKKDFLLGRLCAQRAYEACTGELRLSLPTSADRSPTWPPHIVGSISHSQDWVGAAVARDLDLIGLGIDFELLGRTKTSLSTHIKNPQDLATHPDFNEEELLTLIFSFKESLYKALHPSVKKYFGFQDAAVKEINFNTGVFSIDLLTILSAEFNPSARHIFQGRFLIADKICLSALEIQKNNNNPARG